MASAQGVPLSNRARIRDFYDETSTLVIQQRPKTSGWRGLSPRGFDAARRPPRDPSPVRRLQRGFPSPPGSYRGSSVRGRDREGSQCSIVSRSHSLASIGSMALGFGSTRPRFRSVSQPGKKLEPLVDPESSRVKVQLPLNRTAAKPDGKQLSSRTPSPSPTPRKALYQTPSRTHTPPSKAKPGAASPGCSTASPGVTPPAAKRGPPRKPVSGKAPGQPGGRSVLQQVETLLASAGREDDRRRQGSRKAAPNAPAAKRPAAGDKGGRSPHGKPGPKPAAAAARKDAAPAPPSRPSSSSNGSFNNQAEVSSLGSSTAGRGIPSASDLYEQLARKRGVAERVSMLNGSLRVRSKSDSVSGDSDARDEPTEKPPAREDDESTWLLTTIEDASKQADPPRRGGGAASGNGAAPGGSGGEPAVTLPQAASEAAAAAAAAAPPDAAASLPNSGAASPTNCPDSLAGTLDPATSPRGDPRPQPPDAPQLRSLLGSALSPVKEASAVLAEQVAGLNCKEREDPAINDAPKSPEEKGRGSTAGGEANGAGVAAAAERGKEDVHKRLSFADEVETSRAPEKEQNGTLSGSLREPNLHPDARKSSMVSVATTASTTTAQTSSSSSECDTPDIPMLTHPEECLKRGFDGDAAAASQASEAPPCSAVSKEAQKDTRTTDPAHNESESAASSMHLPDRPNWDDPQYASQEFEQEY
ncbi:hypothetical protein DIPPA_23539 [Diplonema papillatum]|nr:hypothetical protein DIPPA_23539 [Diplonema papillatum]